MEVFSALIVLLILVASYFLPTIVASARGHKNTLAIFLLNLFLGWTLIGWLGALIWSVLAQQVKTPE